MQGLRKMRFLMSLVLAVIFLTGCLGSSIPRYGDLRGFVGVPRNLLPYSLEEMEGVLNPADLVISPQALDPARFYPLVGAEVSISGERPRFTDLAGMFSATQIRTGTKTITIEHFALRSRLQKRILIEEGPNEYQFWGGKGYYLIIGVERYPYLENAPGAEDSARAVKEAFQSNSVLAGEGWLFLDSAARKRAIETAVRDLVRLASRDDYLVLYFAGRMGRDYLSPYDDRQKGWEGAITDWELENWLKGFAGYVTVILDGTESATFADGDPLVPFALRKRKYTVISSAQKDQKAIVHHWSGYGLFTHYLVQGLSADKHRVDRNNDRVITASEIYSYVKREMARYLSENYPDYRQVPELYIGSDENTVILRY